MATGPVGRGLPSDSEATACGDNLASESHIRPNSLHSDRCIGTWTIVLTTVLQLPISESSPVFLSLTFSSLCSSLRHILLPWNSLRPVSVGRRS